MSTRHRITLLGKIVIFLFIAACAVGAWFFLKGDGESGPKAANSGPSLLPAGEKTRVGIAYGTEKRRWLEWAAEEFAKSKEGRHIEIELIPMGSLEGAQAILKGDQRIHVWSPASDLYTDVFRQEWQIKHNADPILKGEALALTPMVFVMWAERYDAFVAKYGEVSFDTIRQALVEPSGWQGIANEPEWGYFKFGHTHPNESNSGLMTLVLMAYDYNRKTANLTLENILNPGFKEWSNEIEGAVSGLANSTGNMMREMVLKGPASFDALMVYENLAIDYLKNAEGRWGELRVSYPDVNMWNDNPYYLLDVPWSDTNARKAAETFLEFLLSDPIQQKALTHGFRPANLNIPVRDPDSPFTTYERYGLDVDLSQMCEPPRAEVINNILAGWQRSRSR